MTISIAEDFSRFPAGRTPADGPFNGQRFREEILVPKFREALSANVKLIVNLDGTFGYSSSFLEEVFGGFVRKGEFEKSAIDSLLEIDAVEPAYQSAKIDAEQYLSDELKAR